jgi:hypothetical protein
LLFLPVEARLLMAVHKVSSWRVAGVALLGAIALEAVLVFSIGISQALTIRQIPSHIAAVVVGAIGGWLFDLFKELHTSTKSSLQELDMLTAGVDALTRKIRYQEQALDMLLECPRHNEALTSLIKASMSDNFRHIPYVGPSDYLRFLDRAVEHSDGYQGVQRRSLRWYRERGAASYLDGLRERKMRYKTRLIILDSDEMETMRQDLNDEDLLAYYWRHTGSVNTYWISSVDFLKNLPGCVLPHDFALYDQTLLISYDEERQILTFDTIDATAAERRIFEALSRHALHDTGVFAKVPGMETVIGDPKGIS